MVYQTLPQTLLQITTLYISTEEFGSLWSLPLQSPHTGDTGNGSILAGLPGINQSGQLDELKYTCVCVVRTLEELRERMNGARMYGHTESIAMTNEAIFTSIINNKNSLNHNYNSTKNNNGNGYGNNHDSTKNHNNTNDNNNMINSKNDTLLIHIKLTPTSSLCDMTIRSQSNQICEYIKISIITIIA